LKFRKVVTVDQEIEIDIGIDDVQQILHEEKRQDRILDLINAAWQILSAVDPERLRVDRRETIADALLRESQRFAPVTRAPYGGTDKNYCTLGYDRLGSSTHPWYVEERDLDGHSRRVRRFETNEQAFEYQMERWKRWRADQGLPEPPAARFEARVCALCEDPFDANVGDGRTLCASCEQETGCDR
jgi:hypothetical protein